MALEITDGIENKQDVLKFLTEECLSFFRRFSAEKETLALGELDSLNEMRAKLYEGIVTSEQLIISATLNESKHSPQIYSQIRKHFVDAHALIKNLLTGENNAVITICTLLVKVKHLMPRETLDFNNFAKLLKKVQDDLSNELGALTEIIKTQKDFAVLAFLGNNLFSEEFSGGTEKDRKLAAVKEQLLPQFVEIMGKLIGRLNELNFALDKNIYSEKENKMVSLAYDTMFASLKNIKV